MQMHEFIDGKKPVMVLIHGVLTPWQIWMPQVTAFQERYNIYVAALNAHTEDGASEFISATSEAEEITEYLLGQNIETVDVLCGLSLGGVIAHEIWKTGRLAVSHLVLDGAPLVPFPKFAEKVMVGNYIRIIHRSRERDPKVLEAFKRDFLPEKYLSDYLKIAELMSDTSIANMVHAAGAGSLCRDVDNRSRILFLHGTKGNELFSRKSAALMKKSYPETEVVCFKGDTHCYKATWEPEKWIEVVDSYLKRNWECPDCH